MKQRLPAGRHGIGKPCSLLFVLCLLPFEVKALASPRVAEPVLRAGTVSFTLDNVPLELSFPSLPASTRGLAASGNANQVATFTDWQPFSELSVTTVPYSTKPGTEQVPVAHPGGVDEYLEALRAFRMGQGGAPVPGPQAVIFGHPTPGILSYVNLYVRGSSAVPAVIVEWVAEAGKRLWIVRAAHELGEGKEGTSGPVKQGSPLWDSLAQLSVISSNVDNPTTIAAAATGGHQVAPTSTPARRESVSPRDLAPPPWWNNSDCDYDHYYSSSGGLGSFRLGGEYGGLAACGPRPIDDGAPDVLVHFFEGSWGEYEFECVELAMRYLYLSYGIAPYSANGNTVVSNYRSSFGGGLARVGNGTPGMAPRPGDVLSYGGASTFGHTSVVARSSVDGSGNGTISVVEENNSQGGESVLSVNDWLVAGNSGSVSGWLTAAGGSVPSPTPTPRPTSTPATGCFGDRFTDVCPGDYFYEPVLSLNDLGAVSGYADGTFRPYNSATRGQIAKIIVLAEGWPLDATGGPHFSDVPTTNPFYPYVETAHSYRVLSGYADGTFRWGTSVTRAQLSKLIVLAQGWPLGHADYQVFIDVPLDHPFYPYIQTAYDHAVISGYADGTFRPGNPATRGQISKIIYGAISR